MPGSIVLPLGIDTSSCHRKVRWWQSSPEAPRRLKEAIERAAHGEFVRYDVNIVRRATGEEIPMTKWGGIEEANGASVECVDGLVA